MLLSAREFAVLEALMARPGAVLSRAQLEDRLYGWGEEIESNAVSVYIHQLRKKLGADFIRNVRGVGYFIDAGQRRLRPMSSIRLRLLVSLVALLVLVAAAMAAITYRNVLGETEALFDYQLQQMALSLRDQGEIASGRGRHARRRAARLRDPDLDRRRPQHLRVARARVAAGARAARPAHARSSTAAPGAPTAWRRATA